MKTMTDLSTLESALLSEHDRIEEIAIASPPGRAMTRPDASRLSDSDIAAVLAAYGLCVVGMWSVHGGMTNLSQGWTLAWTSVTSLSGLLASAVALLALVLVGRPLSLERRFGLDRIWGFNFETGSRSLDVYIGYLRRKTEEGGEPRVLHTIRGVGYVVRPPTGSDWQIQE